MLIVVFNFNSFSSIRSGVRGGEERRDFDFEVRIRAG